jgi:hypothetical protein
MNNTMYGFNLGQKVVCGGETDTIAGFITDTDKENYEMGYRIVLENNGTQALSSVEFD